MAKIKLQTHVSEETRKYIETIAERKKLSISQVIEEILLEHKIKAENKPKMLKFKEE